METVQDHLNYGGFDTWIIVDGATMPQYGVERKEGERKVSCWISSETDKEFSISFRRKQQEQYDYCVTIKLDGHTVTHSIIRNINNGSSTRTLSTVRTSPTEARKFIFAPLELTDDDLHLEDLSSQNIGEISVIIQRVESLGPCYCPSCEKPQVCAVPTNTRKVHERSKKGLAHQIRFSSDKEILRVKPPLPRYKVRPCGEAITFIFKYRPYAMLQAIGIVPRAPSPLEKDPPRRSTAPIDGSKKRKTPEVKTEIDDDDDDLAKERELLAELERVRNRKRAKEDANAHLKKKIKTEPTTYFTPGEVIDLT